MSGVSYWLDLKDEPVFHRNGTASIQECLRLQREDRAALIHDQRDRRRSERLLFTLVPIVEEPSSR